MIVCMFSNNVYAHTGSHEGDCEIVVGQEKLRLSGYQLNSKLPARHYCRIYPQLGELNFQIEFVNPDSKYAKIELKLLSISLGDEFIANPLNIFNQVIKKYLVQVNNDGKILFEAEILEVALYSLEIILTQADGSHHRNRFIFLVGVPVAKIMIGFSVLLLLSLLVTSIKQSFYRQH